MLTDSEWFNVLKHYDLYSGDRTDIRFWFYLLDRISDSYTIVKNGNFLIERVVDKDGQVHCTQVTYPTLVEAIQRMLLQIIQTKKGVSKNGQ
jgi:hypothetical protein